MDDVATAHDAPPEAGYEFDRAVAVTEGQAEADIWRAEIDPRWNIGQAPNGGYLASIAVSALRRVSPHPHPFAVSTHFPSRARPGPTDVRTEIIRTGRTQTTAEARLFQEGETRLVLTATLGDLAALDGPTVVSGTTPAIAPPEQCVKAEGGVAPEFVKRFDLRLTPETAMWAVGLPTGEARMEGWIAFADGRPPDPHGLVVMCDAFPPTVFNILRSRSWVPTIEYTVHVRRIPSKGWMQCRFTTRYLIDGYLEEDGEVWDADGRLVALSRQLARVRTPEGPS